MTGGAPGVTGTATMPDVLEFYYGSFNGPSFYVHLEDGTLISESSNGGVFPADRTYSCPSPGEWEAFFTSIAPAEVFSWLPEYPTAHGCCQATYWHLTLCTPDRQVTSRGSDSRPPHTPSCPDPLGAVLSALRRLTGDRVLMPAQGT